MFSQDLPTMDASTASIMGSEPNIYNAKLSQVNSSDLPLLKTHNSDSEISRLSIEHTLDENSKNQVIFALGDEVNEKLVRISSNNGDQLCLDDVKQICTEIKDYCSHNQGITEGYDVAKHIEHDNIDIAKHMERKASEIENIDLCQSCESNKDGVCDIPCAKIVTDVIVIPSDEAILDTGQSIEGSSKCEKDQ